MDDASAQMLARVMRDIAVRLGAREEVLLSLNNLGLVRRDAGELARAERALLGALRIAELIRNLGYDRSTSSAAQAVE